MTTDELIPDPDASADPIGVASMTADADAGDAPADADLEQSVEVHAADEIELPGHGEMLDITEESDGEEVAVEASPYDRPGRWFVVHTYAGYENKVKQNLASRV